MIRDGRPSGEAYVEVESEDDVQKALERHKCNMGKRYIEVFESKHSDLEYACNKAAGSGFGGTDDPYGDDAVVKLRGLPYDAGKMQIADFFKGGITISENSTSIFVFIHLKIMFSIRGYVLDIFDNIEYFLIHTI